MQEVSMDYGDSSLSVHLPDSATVIEYGKTYIDPEGVDTAEAVRKALANPHGFPPLKELGGSVKKIFIAFTDRVKGGVHATAHRGTSIPIIVEELVKVRTKLENLTLLCAIGLHRKNILDEWYSYLGKQIVDEFYPDRLLTHAGDGYDLDDYGLDEMGNAIQCNRLMADARTNVKAAATFDEATRSAQKYVGKNPNVLCTPRCFTTGMAVHLHI